MNTNSYSRRFVLALPQARVYDASGVPISGPISIELPMEDVGLPALPRHIVEQIGEDAATLIEQRTCQMVATQVIAAGIRPDFGNV